jgi:hypothetical protein
MNLSEDVLLAIAGLCVALIGFSGVVTALGRRGEGTWTSSEMLQLRTLVEPSVIALFGSFVPIVLSLVIADDILKWRTANGLLLAGHVVGISLFWFRGAASNVFFSHRIMTVISILIMLFQVGSPLNLIPWHELAFALSLLLGVSVSVHNFYLLLFERDDS